MSASRGSIRRSVRRARRVVRGDLGVRSCVVFGTFAVVAAALAGPPNPGKPLQPVGVSGQIITVASAEDPKSGPCEDFFFTSVDEIETLVGGGYQEFAFCSDDLGRLAVAEATGGLFATPISGGAFEFTAHGTAAADACCGLSAQAEQGTEVVIELENDYAATWRFDWTFDRGGSAFMTFRLSRPGEAPSIEVTSGDGFAEVELGDGAWEISISSGVFADSSPGGETGPGEFTFNFYGQLMFEGPVGDLDGDFLVTGADLAILLGEWGSDVPGNPADIDGSELVDGADLALLLGNWTG